MRVVRMIIQFAWHQSKSPMTVHMISAVQIQKSVKKKKWIDIMRNQ